MTEAQFQAGIIEVARLLGFKVAHFRAAKTAHGWRTPVAADGAGVAAILQTRVGGAVSVEAAQ